jgi:hypothetical protein
VSGGDDGAAVEPLVDDVLLLANCYRLRGAIELAVGTSTTTMPLLIEAARRTADVDPRLVDRVAEGLAGVTANDQATGLGHESAQVAHGAANHDVDPLHGDPAARSRVAVDDHGAPCTEAGGAFCNGASGHGMVDHRGTVFVPRGCRQALYVCREAFLLWAWRGEA